MIQCGFPGGSPLEKEMAVHSNILAWKIPRTRETDELQSMLLQLLSHFSRVQLFLTLWTVTSQAPLSMGFSRQEYWSGMPCPPPEDLPNPTIEPKSLLSPAIGRRSLYH